MEIISVGYALLAIQRALLDAVTPELRAVVLDIDTEKRSLYMRCYYDGNISEQLIDLWECAISEAHAALGPDCFLDDGVERLDYPKKIPLRGIYAYLRKEGAASRPQSVAKAYKPIERELVDFKEKIGIFVSPVAHEQVDTSWGVIHYAEDGTHIVPARPESYKIEIFLVAYALLGIQRALLGVVMPALRAVIVDIGEKETLLYIRFYYDGEISSEMIEDWECALTESIADFGRGFSFDTRVEKLPYPQEIPFRGRYAYLRKEGPAQSSSVPSKKRGSEKIWQRIKSFFY